jgi:hypothetical protein
VHVEGEPGGGKSFLLHTLLLRARAMGCSCLPSVFPAKVARKFPGGQTAHFWLALCLSTLGEDIKLHAKIPSTSSSSDTKQQAAGRRLREANLIFVDEVTMMRAAELDAVVAKLDELCFRGVFMIVGNCAQLGAVLPGADDSTLIASAVVNADTFERFKHFHLTGQMRMLVSDLRDAVHSSGYGTWPSTSGGNHHACASQRILLPTALFPAISDAATGMQDFRMWVHGQYVAGSPPQGVIVCSTNARAEGHNLALLQNLPDDARTYTARDEVLPVRDGNQAFESAHISSDCARAFNQSGIPPSEVVLKVGVPVYVALNLDRTEGLLRKLWPLHTACANAWSTYDCASQASGGELSGPCRASALSSSLTSYRSKSNAIRFRYASFGQRPFTVSSVTISTELATTCVTPTLLMASCTSASAMPQQKPSAFLGLQG